MDGFTVIEKVNANKSIKKKPSFIIISSMGNQSMVDYTLPDFRNEDGTTRIRYLWDQSLKAVEGEHVPKEYGMGVEIKILSELKKIPE